MCTKWATRWLVAFLGSSFLAGAVFAEDSGLMGGRLSVGPALGSVGVGVEAAWRLTDHFVVRAGPHYATLGLDRTLAGIDYDFDLEFINGAAFVDYHPFANGFRLSGGFFAGKNGVDLDARPSGNVQIGGTTYTPAEVGTVTGNVDLHTFAPYAGLGWVSGFSKKSNWSVRLDAGVKFGGEPSVSIDGNGTLTGDPAFEADLDREAKKIEDDLQILRFYPVVSLGVSYRF